MKKILFATVCFSLLAMPNARAFYATPHYSLNETQKCTENSDLICDLNDNLLNGIITDYDEDGNLLRETPYKNGKKDGVEKGYRVDGSLSYEIPYENDKINGVIKRYRKDGSIQKQTEYKDGQPVSGSIDIWF